MDCQVNPRANSYPAAALLVVLASALSAFADEPETPPAAAGPVAAQPPAQPISAAPTPITRAFRNDAALHSLSFLNPTIGWAVGDRGVIWHTADGGATWQQQSSPVSSTLNAVYFVDSHRGWAVGGQSQPYNGGTRGVVLRSDDGGAIWQQIAQPLLPTLVGVRFFDREHGIAFGLSAAHSPSGVYSTRDGGTTWQPLPTDVAGNWLAGDFLEPSTGAVAGPAGRIATLVRRKVVESPLAASSLRSFRAMRLIAPTGGWAVGDGGLVMTTNDLGRSWQTPPASLSEAAADHFDFRAVAVEGSHVWIAGAPGTRIFHSADSGQTWQSAATNQTAPLSAIHFVDAQNGWAAGALGSILATHDGGQTWQSQRAGAARAALLTIVANPADTPLELLADCGAADGYISAVDVLCSSAASGELATLGSERTREALLSAGAADATTSWRFPLPAADLALEPKDLLAALNRENDGRAMKQIERHLVRALRMWRPDVVVLPHGSSRPGGDPIAALLEPIIASAVMASADPAQHPELATDVGLPPWQVTKVFGLAAPGSRGEKAIDPGHFSPWLGATLGDFTGPSRSIIFASHTVSPDILEFKSLLDSTPPNNARSIFSGITIARGSDARRQQFDLPAQDLDSLRRVATRRRTLEQLLTRTNGNAAWNSQVNQMLEGLGDDDCAQLLVHLAEGYRKSGRLDLAADTYFLFARRTPDHPLVDPALTWLMRFYASGEIAHRLAAQSAANTRHDLNPPPAGNAPAADTASASPKGDKVQQVAALTNIASSSQTANNLSRDDRLRRAAQLADYLKSARPALYADPAVRFAEITAQRQLGFANPAKRYFIALHSLPEADPWRACGATEEWLDKPADGPPGKKLATCRLASAPPHLDGKLDDEIWEKADKIILRSSEPTPSSAKGAGEGQTADVRITHDREFLYIAVHCLKAENVDYPSDSGPRTRDADLSHNDRVSLKFDIDRDYATAFELTVDHRGWSCDACSGDPTWSPKWYVASANEDVSWTVELAIPLAELVDQPPTARSVWAVAARRTIPRTGYQTWSTDSTSDDSPAQFGLLIFE